MAGLVGQGVDHVPVRLRRGEDPGGGGAVLAGVEISGDGDGLRRLLDIGVVEDDHRGLAAQLQVHPLQVRRPPRAATSRPARTLPVMATSCGMG